MQNVFRRLQFNYWYLRRPPWDTGISPPELVELIETHSPGRAIDIGCGTGTNSISLARAGWNVTGVDFAPRAISLAKQKLKAAGVRAEMHVSDATKLVGISGPYDLALDLGCFHGIPPQGQAKYLDQLERILAPNGFWLMYGFLKPAADASQTGLAEVDIERLLARLHLVSRRNGQDTTRGRSSAWFLFQNKQASRE